MRGERAVSVTADGIVVAIVGSRDFPRLSAVDYRVQMLADQYGRKQLIIISGGARGVDRRAIVAAEQHGVRTEEYEADWTRLGRPAGYVRNQRLVEMADRVIAFWDGESKGTKHTIDLALRLRKSLEVHFP